MTEARAHSIDARTLTRWKLAIFAIFLASGLSIATWAARVPDIREGIGVDHAGIGGLLLIGGIGSITGLSVSGLIQARFGTRRGMLGALSVVAVGLVLIGVGTDVLHTPVVVGIGLALWGFGNGAVDVMMNVEGAAIETQTGKTILPLFHAFFSFGTVLGAGLGVVAIALQANVMTHLAIIAAIIIVTAVVAVANVPVHEPEDPAPNAAKKAWRERLHAAAEPWREPRTYLLGVVMLGMAFTEGSATDWLALAVVDGHGSAPALGAVALTVFSVCMTVTRVFGGPLVDRFGRVPTLRVLAVAAAAGLLLFIYAPNEPLMFVGAALWGVGASLGFPLGMSAAADDPAKAAARVSAAATIGYVAFLAGPPLLGLISQQIGILETLLIIVGFVVLSGVFSSAAKPLPGAEVGTGRPHGH